MTKAADWCITWNNKTVVDFSVAVLAQTVRAPGSIAYATAQNEVGDSGTPHVQGFIQFKGPRAMTALQTLFRGAHFEQRMGSAAQAKAYCNKPTAEGGSDADAWEFGNFLPKNAKGKRNDVVAFKDAIMAGATDEVC